MNYTIIISLTYTKPQEKLLKNRYIKIKLEHI